MKKYMKLLFSVFMLFLVIEKYQAFVKAESIIDTTIIASEYQEPIVRAIDIDTVCSMTHTYYNQYEVVIDKSTICYCVVDTTIFGIYYSGKDSILYAYNMQESSYIEETIHATIYDIVYNGETLILVGNENQDACLYRYQKNLVFIHKTCFGGEGYESFTKIIFFHHKLLVFGLKDAFSNSSCFSNVGNLGDLKSFVVTVNENGILEKELYLNEHTTNETIVDITCDTQFCSFLVKDDKDMYHQYSIDEELSVHLKVDLTAFEPNFVAIVPNQKKDSQVIYLYHKEGALYLGILHEKTIHPIYIGEYHSFYCLDIRNGKLEVLLKENNRVKRLIVDEYHIHDIHSFHYNAYQDDYKSTNHFDITSYFEDLTFTFDENLNSYIDYQAAGSYLASYSAKRLDGSIITIETEYVIPPFINIIDEGVYDTQYRLLFTDVVYVDDEKKTNGDMILIPGRHIVKHMTEETTHMYTIYVYENCVSMYQNNIDTDFTIFESTTFYFKMYTGETKEIASIIVNQENYPFVVQDGTIYIPIHATTPGSIDRYTIEKIIYSNQCVYEMNETFTVRTLYQPCTIEANYENKRIIYQLKHAENTVLDIVIKTYQGDQCIEDIHYPLEQISYTIPKISSKMVFSIRYCLGNKEIEEVELGSFVISSKRKKASYIYFDIEKNDEEIVIQVYPSNYQKINIEEVMVQNKNLTNAYIVKENKAIILITIIMSIAIILSVILYFVIRILKKKYQPNQRM